MLNRKIITLIIVFSVVTMACGFTINLPVDEITTGPSQTVDILVPEPDASQADVTLTFGAGELSVEPGGGNALISGTATFNVPEFEPSIKINDDRVRLETGELEITGIPNFADDIKNEWQLKLGEMPMKLTIIAGAYQGDYELGGLSLESLEVADGASEVRMGFSQPNLVEMVRLSYVTGASNVHLSGLANANFTSMIFRGGAGDYTLDFSGELKRDAVVNIESGISHVVIIVPDGVAARVIFKGGLTNISASREWDRSGDEYTLEGSGPELLINVDMGAGSLELRTSG